MAGGRGVGGRCRGWVLWLCLPWLFHLLIRRLSVSQRWNLPSPSTTTTTTTRRPSRAARPTATPTRPGRGPRFSTCKPEAEASPSSCFPLSTACLRNKECDIFGSGRESIYFLVPFPQQQCAISAFKLAAVCLHLVYILFPYLPTSCKYNHVHFIVF